MSKKEKYEKLRSQMHKDYVCSYGILIFRNGGTTIVGENSITMEELDRLLR